MKIPKRNIVNYLLLMIFCILLAASGLVLLSKLNDDTSPYDVANMTIGCIGLACILTALFTLVMEHERTETSDHFFRIVILIAAMFVTEFGYYAWDGNADLRYLSGFCRYATTFFILLALLEFWYYLNGFLGKKQDVRKGWNMLYLAMFAAGCTVLVLNLPFGYLFTIDGEGIYHCKDTEYIESIPPVAMVIMCTAAAVYGVKQPRDMIAFLSLTATTVASAFIQYAYINLEISCIGNLYAILFLYGNSYVGRTEKIIKKEAELVEQRASILISQIQPHFLYNSLTSIMNIKGNPTETCDAISDFGKYMRGNLDSMTHRAPIPLKMEMDHVETYISLEKLALGDGLEYMTNIRDGSILVPSLTIQVLVENAIEHGIVPKGGRGTVSVISEETDRAHILVVTDDGVGFNTSDMNMENQDGDSIGLYGINKRLKDSVNGFLDIKSEPGKGTTAMVIIPKPDKNEKKKKRNWL